VVDWYDHEGRRYIVTRPNPDGDSRSLAPRQRRVLALRARGEALKVIASELGVSMSTAARDLGQAMALLGLHSTADLAAVLGHGTR
jgi:DNA-binding NarL/FixJ family response regulator